MIEMSAQQRNNHRSMRGHRSHPADVIPKVVVFHKPQPFHADTRCQKEEHKVPMANCIALCEYKCKRRNNSKQHLADDIHDGSRQNGILWKLQFCTTCKSTKRSSENTICIFCVKSHPKTHNRKL